jgi:hypothetical protein
MARIESNAKAAYNGLPNAGGGGDSLIVRKGEWGLELEGEGEKV